MLLQAVAVERMAFDVAGQMWLTLIINGIIALSTLVCMVGTFIRQKEAVIAVSCIVQVIINSCHFANPLNYKLQKEL